MKYWFSVNDAFDVSWLFYLVEPYDPILQENVAITFPDSCKVYVTKYDDNLNKTYILALHELLHVLYSAPGDRPVITKIMGANEDTIKDREEENVAFLAPRLFSVLHKNADLKLIFPPLP